MSLFSRRRLADAQDIARNSREFADRNDVAPDPATSPMYGSPTTEVCAEMAYRATFAECPSGDAVAAGRLLSEPGLF